MDTEQCPCKRIKCERHSNCDACREYHHANKRKPFTTCEQMEVKRQKTGQRKKKDIGNNHDKKQVE